MNLVQKQYVAPESISPRVLIMILSSKDPINLEDEFTQRETWATDTPQCKIIWIRGEISCDEVFDSNNRTLYVNVEECAKNILKKTVLALNWVSKQSWKPDIVVRSNVSTYFEIKKLVSDCARIVSLGKKPILAGYFDRHMGNYFSELEIRDFVSGAGIFINSEAVDILRQIDLEDFQDVPDDVAISTYLLKRNVKALAIRRCNMHVSGLFWNSSYTRLKSSQDSDLASARMKMIYQYHMETNCRLKAIKRMRIYAFEVYLYFSRKSRRNHYFRSLLVLLRTNLRNRMIRHRYE